jgi:integrase
MTMRLMKKNPEGQLVRGKGNRPYSKNAIRCRFRRLRKKLPQLGHFISYTFRATFATNALENGVGVAQVAELLGHTSTDMVMRHYGHLNQKVQHMREMAAKATGSPEL